MTNPSNSKSWSILHGAHDNKFQDSVFIMTTERIAAFDKLEKAAAPSGFHSFVGRPDPGKCYPNTRVDLLEGLEMWAAGMELPDYLFEAGLDDNLRIETNELLRNRPIMWLRGGAGVGKSAVAQTFAERCEDLGHIVASFFFFSKDPTRNQANQLVATLAYQIARADPGSREHIETVVHHDPHIFNQDFKKQIVSLIVNSIQESTETLDAQGRRRQCVIIIDGLDECTGCETQAGLVRAVSDALRTTSPDIQKQSPRFLICSRPEEPIKRAFRSPHLQNMYSSIDLSSDTHADHDIYNFLASKFVEIKMTHPRADLIPASWPSDSDLIRLSYNSSRHFIYAQTVVRLVSNDARPVAAIKAIVELRALPQRVRESFAELDELYRHILLRALEKSSIDTIRHVLGFIIMVPPTSRFHPDITADFLGFEDGELDTLLSNIASLAYLQPLTTIAFYHKSIQDFLHDEHRAGQFHIEDGAVRAYVWTRCLDMASRKDSLDEEAWKFVKVCTFRTQNRLVGFLAGEKSHSFLGLTLRRNHSTFFLPPSICAEDLISVDDQLRWADNCFRYWVELLRSAESSYQLIRSATGIMADIITDLLLDSDPTVPLLMCRKPSWPMDVHPIVWTRLEGYFGKFLFYCLSILPDGPFHLIQGYFSALKSLLEDEKMREFRLTGERFAEACLSWMKHLTKKSNAFPSTIKQVLPNQPGLIINESARRRRAPFRWRKATQSVRPHHKKGRLNFLRNPQEFHSKVREDVAVHIFGDTTQLLHEDTFRRQRFKLVLSRIPAMLAQATKSDAVAALRLKAFPPLCWCFPKLMRRARQALEEYAAKHGYASLYLDTGRKYATGILHQEALRLKDRAAPSTSGLAENIALMLMRMHAFAVPNDKLRDTRTR